MESINDGGGITGTNSVRTIYETWVVLHTDL